MARSSLALLAVIVLSIVVLVGFQNCGRFVPNTLSTVNTVNTLSTLNTPSTVSTVNTPSATISGLSGCPAGFTLVNNACIDSSPAHMTLSKQDTQALPGKIQVSGIGSNAFDPAKLKNWISDERGPVIVPNPGDYRNIYSPQAVQLSGSTWRIYFHGYNGISAPVNDRIYTTATHDDFLNFEAHFLQIDHGIFENVGNESVVRISPTDWRMTYTTYLTSAGSLQLNKTAYSTSSDGVNWSPSAGDRNHFLTMSGYPEWANGDFNGVNPIFQDAQGLWHYYFMDSRFNKGVEHATSNDGVNFNFQNRAVESFFALNDLKSFLFNKETFYAGCYHQNNDKIWVSVSQSLSQLGVPQLAFQNSGSADRYMPTCGWVQDGQRILGILYGGGPTSSLDQNLIFARWLQKKVVFHSPTQRLEATRSFGPNNSRIAVGSGKVQTGKFFVYDTDGTTLIYISPEVSIRPGDVWQYTGP